MPIQIKSNRGRKPARNPKTGANYLVKPVAELTLPHEFGIAPLFSAQRLDVPREVCLADGTRWTMGVAGRHHDNPMYHRGLDVRHAEVIFSLLSFYRTNALNYGDRIDLSYNLLLDIVGWGKGSRQLALLKDILGDLENIWTQIERDDTRLTFKVLGAIAVEEKISTETQHLRYITFDPTFLEFIESIEKYLSIQLDVWKKMTSNVAKAIYLYLPSRAVKNTEASPFKITLTTLLGQIEMSVPKYKSQRKQIFDQHNPSIVAQLNNSRIQYNRKLRVKLEDTVDGKDVNLCAWTEPLTDRDYLEVDYGTSLRAWYIAGKNGSGEDFDAKIAKWPELNGYEIDCFKTAGVDINQSITFLRMAKALLPEFSELCGELKHQSLAGDVRNPTAYLIGMVRRQLTGDLFSAMN